jgi:hypothetical protein
MLRPTSESAAAAVFGLRIRLPAEEVEGAGRSVERRTEGGIEGDDESVLVGDDGDGCAIAVDAACSRVPVTSAGCSGGVMGRMDESAECTMLTVTLGGNGGRFTDCFEGVAATAEEGDDDGVTVDEDEAGDDGVAEGEVADVAVDEAANKVLDGVSGDDAIAEESAPATTADIEAAKVVAAEVAIEEEYVEGVMPAADG